jgi:hypothetical protein
MKRSSFSATKPSRCPATAGVRAGRLELLLLVDQVAVDHGQVVEHGRKSGAAASRLSAKSASRAKSRPSVGISGLISGR